MKILILFLFLSISPIELRRHEGDMYELDDLFNDKYNRPKHHSNKQYIPDPTDDDDDQYDPSLFQQEKVYPSRKKVLGENVFMNEESDSDDATTRPTPSPRITTVDQNDESDTSTCINTYDIKPEQIIKVKELNNGAHILRHFFVDKRTLPSNLKVKDSCMLDCCSEKLCDVAMLSEQPTNEGYKCYLFACNGSCPIAFHQDYVVMMPKKYSADSTKSTEILSTSTTSDVYLPRKKSIFLETSVILFLAFGIICTILLFVLLGYYCRVSRKRGRMSKNYAVDADYLINGLYL